MHARPSGARRLFEGKISWHRNLKTFDGGALETTFRNGAAKTDKPAATEVRAFFAAISDNDFSATKAYVDKYGSNIIEGSAQFGWTPLTLACAGGPRGEECLQIVTLLLNAGADIERRDRISADDSNTPLMIAARNFQHETIKLLLDRGANPAAVDGRGYNARQLLAQREFRNPNAPVPDNFPADDGLRLLDKALADKAAAAKNKAPEGPKQ